MGNFSISHYAGIRIERDQIELLYLVDLAEIPTFQEIQQTHLVPKEGDPSLVGYLSAQAEVLKAGLLLEIDGRALPLEVLSQNVIFPPGAGGLPTMKLGFLYRGTLPATSANGTWSVHYLDRNFPERVGWKEVVAGAGEGIRIINSSVPEHDRSQQLANYPTNLLNSPPQVLEAHVDFASSGLARDSGVRAARPSAAPDKPASAVKDQTHWRVAKQFAARDGERAGSTKDPGGEARSVRSAPQPSRLASAAASRFPNRTSAAANSDSQASHLLTGDRQAAANSVSGLKANQQGTPRSEFTELITRGRFGFWFLLTAAVIAAGLGALHALEPGHGKTIVAAYLVGSRGTARHACLLGLIVTASHTAGVYLLGLVTLYASRYILPERLYPWLSVISGLSIAGLGSYLFLKRYAAEGSGHSHAHAPAHDHHSHSHWPGHYHTHEIHDEHGHAHLHAHEHPRANSTCGGGDTAATAYRELLALGVTGGIVPCPAALVVLLSAVTVHRIGFGLFLIIAFSIGLAAVLIAIGLLMVFAGRHVSRLRGEGPLVTRWLPLTSAAVITVLGLVIAARALVTAGLVHVHI